jgi:multiple sugar transport system permease protein
MNAQNLENKPVVKRESKNKIRVDFDRTPLKDRLKAKFLSGFFVQKLVIWIFRLVLMVGISYIVLYPFLTKIMASMMAPQDFIDSTVRLIPKNFTLDIYRAIINELGYFEAFTNTFILSFSTALIQMFICCLIGYGFAKFKFKGRNLLFALVVLTMIIPHQTIQYSMAMQFRYFDILGIFKLLKGGGIELFGHNIMELGAGFQSFFSSINILPDAIGNVQFTANGVNMMNTYAPFIVLSLGALAFKNGLYIFLLRQFFRGVPDELEESAYMDGSGVFRTFFRIILPLSIPMMITVFLFAFCWQWTDNFYTNLFFQKTSDIVLFGRDGFVAIPKSLEMNYAGSTLYNTAIRNTCGLMIIAPLVVLYIFCQNFLVQGIEQSGLAN